MGNTFEQAPSPFGAFGRSSSSAPTKERCVAPSAASNSRPCWLLNHARMTKPEGTPAPPTSMNAAKLRRQQRVAREEHNRLRMTRAGVAQLHPRDVNGV